MEEEIKLSGVKKPFLSLTARPVPELKVETPAPKPSWNFQLLPTLKGFFIKITHFF